MATTREKRKKRQRASASRRAEKRASGSKAPLRLPDGLTFFKKKEGTKKINIVEYKAGKGNPHADEGIYHYERTFYVHFYQVAGETVGRLCTRKTLGKKCAVCEHISVLQKDEDHDEKLVASLIPKERQIMLVNDPKNEEHPLQLYEDAYANFGDRLDTEVLAEKEDNPDVENFAAAGSEGKTLRVSFVEESFMGRKFIKADAIKFLDRDEDASEEPWDHEHCLDKFLVVPDYEQVKKELLGDDDDDEDEEEDKKKKTKSKAKDDEDEDEDTDDDDEENEDGEEDETEDEEDGDSEEEDETDEEGDDEEEDDEDDDGPPVKFKKGDTVTFKYKGKSLKGKVIKVDVEHEIIRVKTPDKEQPYNLDIDDKTIKISKPKEEDDDEGEEEEESPKKKTSTKKSKGGSQSKTSEDDEEDDDIPFEDDEDSDEDEEEDDED